MRGVYRMFNILKHLNSAFFPQSNGAFHMILGIKCSNFFPKLSTVVPRNSDALYLIFKYYLNKLRLPGLEGPELIVVTVQ
jgi:hypothetical protein